MRIGSIEVHPDTALAPMATVTNVPFRALAKEMGCGLTVTEMLSSEGLVRRKLDLRRLERAEGETPLAVQIFGGDPGTMAEAAVLVEEAGAEIVDVNMGCPVRKITGGGGGVALMRDPALAAAVVGEIVRRVRVPVTAKMRAGWDSAHVNATEVARALEGVGASAITVHARTREQVHSGTPRWEVIAGVKEAVHIPVVGNGGVRSVDDARIMRERTGCDMVMVGRGAQGNPWIFRSLAAGEESPPTIAERFDTIRRHLRHYVRWAGAFKAVHEMRKHLCWYLRGLPRSASVRSVLHRLTTEESYLEVLDDYERSLDSDVQ